MCLTARSNSIGNRTTQLTNRTNGRAYAPVLRLSVVVCRL